MKIVGYPSSARIETPYKDEDFVEERNPYFTFGKERKRPTHDAVYGNWEPVEPSISQPAHRWDPISIKDMKEEMTTLESEDEQTDTSGQDLTDKSELAFKNCRAKLF